MNEHDNTKEEPQSARGAPGSRDTGADEAGGGPADRPAENADAESHTGIDPKAPITDTPIQQSGGG